MSGQSSVKIFNPEGHPPLAPSYSHGSIVPISPTCDLVSFSGQTGTTTDLDASNPPSFQEQVRTALAHVDKCLAGAGCTKANIVSGRKYIPKMGSLSPEDFKAQGQIFLEWWRSTEGDSLPPPDTLIGVDCLYRKECLFEIEITAIRTK